MHRVNGSARLLDDNLDAFVQHPFLCEMLLPGVKSEWNANHLWLIMSKFSGLSFTAIREGAQKQVQRQVDHNNNHIDRHENKARANPMYAGRMHTYVLKVCCSESQPPPLSYLES